MPNTSSRNVRRPSQADRQNAEDGAGSEATDSADEGDTGDSDNDDEEEMREEGDDEKAEAGIAESDEEDSSDDDQDSEDDAHHLQTSVNPTTTNDTLLPPATTTPFSNRLRALIPPVQVLMTSVKVSSVAINLQKDCSELSFMDVPSNAQSVQQCGGRVVRIGHCSLCYLQSSVSVSETDGKAPQTRLIAYI